MKNLKIICLGILATFLIVAIGWGIVNYTIGSIDSSNDVSMQNTTSSYESSSNTVYNIGGLFLAILAIIAIIVLLAYIASSQERYESLGKILEFLVNSAYYFVFGLLAIAIVGVPGYLIYLLYNYAVLDGHGGELLPYFQWVGIIVVAFFGISALGYVFKKKIFDKIYEYRNKAIIKGD